MYIANILLTIFFFLAFWSPVFYYRVEIFYAFIFKQRHQLVSPCGLVACST